MAELLAYPWWVLGLMAAGAVAVAVFVVWPILWIVLYGAGFTIFNAILLDGGRARAHPWLTLRAVCWRWPLEGMREAITWPAESTSARGWVWRPFFHYYRSD